MKIILEIFLLFHVIFAISAVVVKIYAVKINESMTLEDVKINYIVALSCFIIASILYLILP